MLSLEESLKILKETNALIEGHFILSSGLHSSKYVQCAQLMSRPEYAVKICESLSNKIKNEFKDFDLILSPAMGGILVGYELGKMLNKKTIFSERVNGDFKLRRDFRIKENDKVLIVEDVITTGKSSIEHALSFAEKHNPERKKVKCVNFLEITETEVCSILKERVTELRSQINKSSKIKILD